MLLLAFLVFFLAGNDFDKVIQNYLQGSISSTGRVEIVKTQYKKDLSEVQLDKSRSLIRKYNIAFIPVNIKKGNRLSEEYLSVQFKLYEKVLLAETDLNRNDLITTKSFTSELKDVTMFNKMYCSPDSFYEGYRTKFNIKKGSVIYLNDIEKIPVIKSGDVVKAEYKSQLLNVSIPVTARKDGTVGDIITVLTNSNKLLKARICQNKIVEIIE